MVKAHLIQQSRIYFYKMIHARKFCVLIIFCFFFVAAFSQKELQLADKLFNEKRYGEAIPLYDKIYEKKRNRKVLLKLADANYLNENYPQAQTYYAEYFRDSVYEHIPQFMNYARSSKNSGKMTLAVKLFQKQYDVNQDSSSKEMLNIYKLYVDSAQYVRSYDLDSNYNCVLVDATESLDTEAGPMSYSWAFDDGTIVDGLKVEHCFSNDGPHQVLLNVTDKRTGMVRQRDTLLWTSFEHLPIHFSSPKTIKRYFYTDLDASGTEIPGFHPVDYLWNMDNGEIVSGKKIKYKYNDSRAYRVKLVVVARDNINGKYRLYSANRNISVVESYEMPSKKFSDSLNGSK